MALCGMQEENSGIAAKLWAAARNTVEMLMNENETEPSNQAISEPCEDEQMTETNFPSQPEMGNGADETELKIGSVFTVPLDAYLTQKDKEQLSKPMEQFIKGNKQTPSHHIKCKPFSIVLEKIDRDLAGRHRVFYRQWKRRFSRCGTACRLKHVESLYPSTKETADSPRLRYGRGRKPYRKIVLDAEVSPGILSTAVGKKTFVNREDIEENLKKCNKSIPAKSHVSANSKTKSLLRSLIENTTLTKRDKMRLQYVQSRSHQKKSTDSVKSGNSEKKMEDKSSSKSDISIKREPGVDQVNVQLDVTKDSSKSSDHLREKCKEPKQQKKPDPPKITIKTEPVDSGYEPPDKKQKNSETKSRYCSYTSVKELLSARLQANQDLKLKNKGSIPKSQSQNFYREHYLKSSISSTEMPKKESNTVSSITPVTSEKKVPSLKTSLPQANPPVSRQTGLQTAQFVLASGIQNQGSPQYILTNASQPANQQNPQFVLSNKPPQQNPTQPQLILTNSNQQLAGVTSNQPITAQLILRNATQSTSQNSAQLLLTNPNQTISQNTQNFVLANANQTSPQNPPQFVLTNTTQIAQQSSPQFVLNRQPAPQNAPQLILTLNQGAQVQQSNILSVPTSQSQLTNQTNIQVAPAQPTVQLMRHTVPVIPTSNVLPSTMNFPPGTLFLQNSSGQYTWYSSKNPPQTQGMVAKIDTIYEPAKAQLKPPHVPTVPSNQQPTAVPTNQPFQTSIPKIVNPVITDEEDIGKKLSNTKKTTSNPGPLPAKSVMIGATKYLLVPTITPNHLVVPSTANIGNIQHPDITSSTTVKSKQAVSEKNTSRSPRQAVTKVTPALDTFLASVNKSVLKTPEEEKKNPHQIHKPRQEAVQSKSVPDKGVHPVSLTKVSRTTQETKTYPALSSLPEDKREVIVIDDSENNALDSSESPKKRNPRKSKPQPRMDYDEFNQKGVTDKVPGIGMLIPKSPMMPSGTRQWPEGSTIQEKKVTLPDNILEELKNKPVSFWPIVGQPDD